jgi:DNA adenine methylase
MISLNRYKTPLRYPGGKQKLAPFVAEIMAENNLQGGHYIEPYAGGAGVAVELLLNGIASHIHLNDSCSAVYSFWKSIINETEEFCRRISRASLNVREWRKQQEVLKNRDQYDELDVGFSTFYLNRVNRSGILSGGLIGGIAQEGKWLMDARFSRMELIRRIENIARYKRCINLRNWDAERFITTYLPRLPKESLVYCDPPYFEKADRLYLNHYRAKDHRRIAEIIQEIALPWIVSYDAAPDILEYYSYRKGFIYGLRYNAQKSRIGTEVFLFSDQLKINNRSAVKSIDVALSDGKLKLMSEVMKMMVV